MTRTFLITSGAYVEPELEAEFGRLPPAFLPLGSRRLFQHQRAIIGDFASRMLLSLPESFAVDEADRALLQELEIETIFVPEGLSLGESLIYVINVTAVAGAPLSILHGDTLLRGLDFQAVDAVSVEASPPPSYRWGFASAEGGVVRITPGGKAGPNDHALSGYFSFASTALLVQAVTRRGGDFLAGLMEYADTRSMAPLAAAEWLDFGHAGTYHQSRRRVTTEREFNRLTATRRTVVKSGTAPAKLEAEARWFEGMPPALRLYAPAYLGRKSAEQDFSYELEYLHLPTLADLFVFGRLRREAWDGIFQACDEFLSRCAEYPGGMEATEGAQGLYLEKTLHRLHVYARNEGIDLNAPCRFNGAWLPSLEQMVALAAQAVPAPLAKHLMLVHGDFCFSNILYDTRASMIRVIDPRGVDSAGRFSIHGDIRYDIGKLYHSAVGLYDYIIAGNCHVRRRGATDLILELPDTPALRQIRSSFLGSRFADLTPQEAGAPAIATLLFFSMLPLHSDDKNRQNALLANGMRLFLELDRQIGG